MLNEGKGWWEPVRLEDGVIGDFKWKKGQARAGGLENGVTEKC